MTSSLSVRAQASLNEINSMQFIDGVKKCLDLEYLKFENEPNNISDLIQNLAEFMKENHSEIYLWHSNTAIRSSKVVHSRAQKWVKNGFKFHGELYDLNKPFNWKLSTNLSRNHRYKIQSWYMIDEVLRASLSKGNEQFFEVAFRVAIDWIDCFIFGDEINEFTWYDMGVGQRSSLLAYITQKAIINFSDLPNTKTKQNRIKNIAKLIIASNIHVIELMDEERLASHSNHGLYQMSGLLSLVKSIPFLQSAMVGVRFATESLEKMLSEHFFEDGFHKEHSPMYHMYVTNYLHQLEQANWLSDSIILPNLAKNSKSSVQKMIMPDGFFAPLGDSSLTNPAELLCLFELNTDSKGKVCCPPGLHYSEDGGVVIISHHTEDGIVDEHLVFSGQFHSRQHKHADDLSINYCVNGKPFLVDAGTFTYHYDQPERMFVESTRAHNAVEIDGLNYSRFRVDCYGSALSTLIKAEGGCTIIEGTLHHKNLISSNIPNNKVKMDDAVKVDIIHKRLIIHQPQEIMAVIDFMISNEEHQYCQWFHFSRHLKTKKVSNSIVEILDVNGELHSTIHHLNKTESVSDVILIRGQQEPIIQGFHSTNGLELIDNDSLGFSSSSKNSVMCTVFDLKGRYTKPYLNIASNGNFIRLVMGENENKQDITIRKKQDSIEIERNGIKEKIEKLI